MDERRVADYFVVAGLPDQDTEVIETNGENQCNIENGGYKLEDWCQEGATKDTNLKPPITDLAIIFPALGEDCPEGYTMLEYTDSGFKADLNHGSLRTEECYLCYRRGRDKPPLVDIGMNTFYFFKLISINVVVTKKTNFPGVIYDGKERIMKDAEIVTKTPTGLVANVNNSTSRIFVTYRRASKKMPCNSLVVTDVRVILTNKGETPPHAFCVIGKNLNKGMLGSDVFLCYKKSMNRANLISFKPSILYKYPMMDYNTFQFPHSVAMFCLPMGATIECWPKIASKPKPVFSTFVLTVADAAQKIYGSAITFYEEVLPPDSISENEKNKENSEVSENDSVDSTDLSEIINSKPLIKKKIFKKFGILKKLNLAQLEKLQYTDPSTQSLNISKSICILSHWPFFDTFERFLVFLHSLVNRQPQNVPIEKYISYFLCDIPFPSPQRPRILVQLSSTDRLILTQPEDLALPRSGASFRQLLMNLGADNCMLILLLILTEQKILVHSLRPDVLTSVSEAISMILFPFKWQCPYIPLCPLGLAEVLHAPLPFLIGVDSRFFDLDEPPADIHCVNLDTNNIAICEDKRYLNNKLLPKKAARMLKSSLEKLYLKLQTINRDHAQSGNHGVADDEGDFSVDKEFQQKHREQALELEIQDAFLRFMALILKGYRAYLLPITKAPTVGTTDPTSLFNINAFLRSRDKNHAKFYSMLVRTQMFIRFIEERSFVSDMDMTSLAFFDDCTERVEEDNNMLLEMDMESQHSERTVFIPPPEADPHQEPVVYTTFKLNSKLMRPRKNCFLKNPAIAAIGIVPGSPMARRTQQEIKVAQRMARKQAAQPERWGRCLLNTCYSLWFLHLPAMLHVSNQPANLLHQAYELLIKMQKLRLDPMEEVCYRAMMQLCGVYGQPLLAVKLLFHMKRSGVQPNALTYGFYNKAVLEATWPSDMTNSSQLMWNKLRNVIVGAALFKKAGKKRARRRSCSNNENLLLPEDLKGQNLEHAISRSSLDSNHSQDTEVTRSDSLKGSSIPDLPTFTMNEKKKLLPRQNSIVKDAALLPDSQPDVLERTPSDPRLARNGDSPVKSPVRTPVTENDPLGALVNDDTPIVSPCEENDSNCSTSTLTVLTNAMEDSRPGGPLLFRNSATMPRSATFHQPELEGGSGSSHLQRSETMPHNVQGVEQDRERERLEIGSLWAQNKDSVTSSLSSIGSSLKLSFGRYSTGGLAFAKNKDLLSKNQLIESLSLSSYISPSSLTGKKSNEIILGGLNSLKSAASSVAKKFDEIKEAISATSTPVKIKEREQRLNYGVSNESLDSLTDGSQQDRNEVSVRMADSVKGDHNVELTALYELAECLYPRVTRDNEQERVAVELVLSSASRCHNCSAILYDEEIMAGWQPEDSNLNTICQFCDKQTVPFLNITILDYRCESGKGGHDPLMAGLLPEPRVLPEPFSVPYLNPLVLRKELESVLNQEGDSCLTKHRFIQEHPIVYWNLIWYYERVNLSSHLPELWLEQCDEHSSGRVRPLSTSCVGVRTLWDNEKLHVDKLPMYIQWRNNVEDRTFMQNVITYVRRNDLVEPIKRVALERHRNRNGEKSPFSVYRDILFLAFIVLGRGNIDQGVFDREYLLSLDKLSESEEELLCSIDTAPSTTTLYCRHYFKQLSV
uniref:UDENN domain-containing protein n=1 Tax=Trichogramma kaykai TaxID=54128 RepID=A0ABD2WNI0_9HYME